MKINGAVGRWAGGPPVGLHISVTNLLHLTEEKSTSLCKGEFIVIGNIIDSNLNIFFPWAFLVCISLGVAPRIVNLIVCHRNSIVDILLVLTTVPILRARDL